MTDSVAEKAAATLLIRAVQLENEKRYTESLACYLEGLNILLESLKDMKDVEKKKLLRPKVETFMSKAEHVKQLINKEKQKGTYHEQVKIEADSTRHSYEAVFGRFLDGDVLAVTVEDPYIRAYHQCQNFLCACELFVKRCPNLKQINLLTTEDQHQPAEQRKWLSQIENDLYSRFNIQLLIEYSTTLHDRQIRLNNGWIIKIGRGLDYFKAPENKFTLGVHDLDLRMCHETVVDIFHRKALVQSLK